MANQIPDGINRDHILSAIEDLRLGVSHAFGDSTGYDVLYEGHRYPPKAVVGLAAGKLLGSPLGPYDFKGGQESKCFRILQSNGFKIVSKLEHDPDTSEVNNISANSWLADVVETLTSLGGIADLRSIYDQIENHRQALPRFFRESIRKTLEINSSDSRAWNRKNDIFYSVGGLREGMWGLRSMLPATPQAVDFADPPIPTGTLAPIRGEIKAYRIIRDSVLCRELKALYQNRCQVCGFTITLPSGEMYSEAHHIKPLGEPHNGPDTAENIIVVCPNHHAMLDYCAMELLIHEFTTHPKHALSAALVAYHNDRVPVSFKRADS